MQEIWVGTKAQAAMRSPSYKGFTKKEIRTVDPTRLKVWYLEKKELNKEKLNEQANAVGFEA